jgi:RNA polymerase sigma-70 factor, ECF subfamily
MQYKKDRSAECVDQTLIEAIAFGDRAAMDMLYARHKTQSYRFIVRIVKDPVLAEDILSEVFLSVWQNAKKFKSESRVRTWILAIAKNQALSAKRTPRATTELAEAENIVDSGTSPEEAVLVMDRNALIRRCISRLSVDHREIIDLVYYQGQTIEEVAQVLSIPINTVKTRMFYARQKLKDLLQKYRCCSEASASSNGKRVA